MKKKNLLVLGAVLIGVAIILISLGWPPISNNDASGAFTKTDKYRKKTVKDGDIVLNSELLSDSNKTKKVIADLVQFGDFALYVKEIIIQVWLPELEKYNSSAEINTAITNLNEYSSFIDNNSKTIQNTVISIVGFYANNKKEVSEDLESQLKQFYNFANQFLQRDSIFESTISKIDNSINNDNARKKEIAALKNLRDRIVIDNFFYGFSIGDSSKIIFSASQVLNNPKVSLQMFSKTNLNKNTINNFGIYANGHQYGMFNQLQQQALTSNLEGANLGFYANIIKSAINHFGSNQYFTGYSMYFSFNQEKLNGIFNKENLNLILGDKVLNLYDNMNLIPVGNTVTLGLALNTSNLGLVLNKENLGVSLLSADKFNAISNQQQIGICNVVLGLNNFYSGRFGAINNQTQIGSAQ